ncbi:MAG: ketopantoate reductase family protein [Candidatus Omnitrophota bacterium]
MKTAVIGCGAIGGLFLGKLSECPCDLIGVVRGYQKKSLEEEGLIIETAGKSVNYQIKIDTKLNENPDVAIFTVKINDLEQAVRDNIENLKDTIIVSTQNGIKAERILSKYFGKDKIITGIVMFGATFYAPNKVVHNFGKDLILGNIFGAVSDSLEQVQNLLSGSFEIKISNNIKGAKYLKLFINLNNCIPAVLGLSMQETFADLDCARLAIRLNREAYAIAKNSGIELESLPSYPKQKIEGLASIGLEYAAELFSKLMISLSKEPLDGSILQSIKRSRKSEIDYINGEIVELAKESGFDASLNEKIVELVHRVEDSGKFLEKKDLLEQFR